MINTALTDWLSINSLAWSLLRIAIVWLAFYGTGSLILRIELIKKHFNLMPSVIAGMLLYMGVVVVLSLFHLLTRRVVPVFIIVGAMTGLVLLYIRIKKSLASFRFSMKHPPIIVPFLLAGYILVTNIMIAGRPDMFQDDPHVTYIVQQDRWLNSGHIYFLEETIFSGMPLISEVLSVLPSSLADNKIDQLILVQLFEMSLLIALILFGHNILGFNWKWIPALVISIAGCYQLVLWGHMAKPDTTALFFVTLALLILLKQTEKEEHSPDLSTFPIMGLALASKQTAYLALIPFTLLLIHITRRNQWSFTQLFYGVLLLFILPAVFAVRTMIHTGSPFYPHGTFEFMLKPDWIKPELNLTFFRKIDRSSEMYEHIGFFRNIWHYFREWGSSILLLITGYLFIARSNNSKKWILLIVGIALYSALSLILFYPAWWGAKYGILLIPFAAIFGIYLLRNFRFSLILVTCIVSLIYLLSDSPLSSIDNYGFVYRFRLLTSYVTGEWKCEKYSIIEQDSYTPALQWMNEHLPEGSRILSLFARKRYLSNHEFYVLERHPISSRLLCENSLEEEISILEAMHINYILSSRNNPFPSDGENTLEILTRRGIGEILEPVMYIDNYIIYEFQQSNY